ncbi:hypothetical protein MLN87_07450 [Escherichia coli]|nr:hypothetical protein [Escherichia coli]MCN8204099.1 hypothetical protein [Escherichia coli]HAI3384521.1 hypothetical protein [Escherichia coli]HAL0004659.1 hypothetical protein [Escherichia coli]HAP1524001.1 hypothetical protein [Escherichia coli]
MMPRPKTILVNPYKTELQNKYLDHDLPYWLDDVLTGASRSQGSSKISPMMLLTLLTVYDSITTDEIKTFLNRKREAIEGRSVTSESYLREIRKALTCAINAIEHQLANGKQWSDESYVRGSLDVMVGQFKRLNSREAVNTETGEVVEASLYVLPQKSPLYTTLEIKQECNQ